MTRVCRMLLLAAAATAAAQAPSNDVAHMQFVREVLAGTPDSQHYVVVDEATWGRARADLGDLRLRDEEGQAVPYALRTRGPVREVQELPARILQPGTIGGRTRFWIQVPDAIEEYDRVRLDLAARNFAATALAEGAHDDAAREWVALGESSLFDFTRERLGSSFVLQLPPTRFRYLRITLPGDVRPDQVNAAHVARSGRREAEWMPLSATPDRREADAQTVLSWSAAGHIPLELVRFDVEDGEQNFSRRVEIRADGRVVATGTIRRINRVGNRTVRIEELQVPVPGVRSERFEAVVHNGDDPPLRIARLTPMVLERRLYFDPAGRENLQLFFGDADSRPPDYEFARLFREEAAARAARVGDARENPAFAPRPDTRPWSERHPWLIWTALVLAVLALGTVALRALRHA